MTFTTPKNTWVDGESPLASDLNLHANNLIDLDSRVSGISTDITNHENDANAHSSVVSLNTSHRLGDGSDHADVAANTTHSLGDGTDHSAVSANATHRTGDGMDHSKVSALHTISTNLGTQGGTTLASNTTLATSGWTTILTTTLAANSVYVVIAQVEVSVTGQPILQFELTVDSTSRAAMVYKVMGTVDSRHLTLCVPRSSSSRTLTLRGQFYTYGGSETCTVTAYSGSGTTEAGTMLMTYYMGGI